jgi:hypothetical protein
LVSLCCGDGEGFWNGEKIIGGVGIVLLLLCLLLYIFWCISSDSVSGG